MSFLVLITLLNLLTLLKYTKITKRALSTDNNNVFNELEFITHLILALKYSGEEHSFGKP